MENKEIKQLTEADIDAIAGGLGPIEKLRSMDKKDIVKNVLITAGAVAGVGVVGAGSFAAGACAAHIIDNRKSKLKSKSKSQHYPKSKFDGHTPNRPFYNLAETNLFDEEK